MLKHFKKSLRKEQTDAESILWFHLRNRNFQNHKFRRQHVLCDYIVDFVCLEGKLVIELDGDQHAEAVEYDAERTLKIEGDGFRVVRFWNNEIFNDLDSVLEVIYEQLNTRPAAKSTPHPPQKTRRPLPQGER